MKVVFPESHGTTQNPRFTTILGNEKKKHDSRSLVTVVDVSPFRLLISCV
jgi:hypothetical protein